MTWKNEIKKENNKESPEYDTTGMILPKDFPFKGLDNPRPNEAELRLNAVMSDVEKMLDYFKNNYTGTSYTTARQVAFAAKASIKQLERFTLPLETSHAGGRYG
tara:strand:+ start:1317 stop:1628 length:312 start_codon:yes stop_codon:yes gene_type:complete